MMTTVVHPRRCECEIYELPAPCTGDDCKQCKCVERKEILEMETDFYNRLFARRAKRMREEDNGKQTIGVHHTTEL